MSEAAAESTEPAVGRKSRSGSQKRRKLRMVTSGYDDEEYAELEVLARRAGLTRASFQRERSLTKIRTRSTKRAAVDGEMVAKVLAQLGKIGSNLNQLAHAAHLKPMSELQQVEMRAMILQLRATLPLLLEALGRAP
jgi:hypothetical protein